MSGRRGTTLVTVMVSAAIVAIALAAASSAFIGTSRLAKHASYYATASNYAEGVVERVCSQPFASINNAEVRSGLPDLPQAMCRISVSKPEAGLKEVTVTCFWVEGNRPCRVRFSTLAAGGEKR